MSVTRLFANEPTPALDAFEALVILGGPMSVNDDERFDWLQPEKQFIRRGIDGGKRVLGICLGAQLIANAMGAKVLPNREREIGWFPVQQTPISGEHAAFASLPDPFPALHWHGDMFNLPDGATWLARSEGCAHQAFSIGERVLGLQFHLESTVESVEALIQHCPGDLAAGHFVQDAQSILAAHNHFRTSNRLMTTLLDQFISSR